MGSIDLNCDMGESFGSWSMGPDAELMRYVSSVNIACGFHAGDAGTMRTTVELAVANRVAIGAHPGYPDLQGFGRRNMSMAPQELHDAVLYQISALKGICEAYGGRLNHVKPHGAMYNQAAANREMSQAIAEAVLRADPSLIVYGLSGSALIEEADRAGLRSASEAFADRTYRNDGSLTPRSEPDALVADVAAAAAQAVSLARSGTVLTIDGAAISVKADTICIHGDGANALEFAAAISAAFAENGIDIRSIP
ncbi:MAG: LamB/YcsF family protein [Acidobacteria bacterium]|nr:LamB/YcsF family protein [Acidobacteriota bacterium]